MDWYLENIYYLQESWICAWKIFISCRSYGLLSGKYLLTAGFMDWYLENIYKLQKSWTGI